MAATLADVRRIAPEFAAVSDDDVTAFLADAALELNASTWGTLYDRAHALVTAHLVAQANPSLASASGPVASESVGGVSRSYAVAAPSAGRWGGSRFGVELYRLMRQTGPALRVV